VASGFDLPARRSESDADAKESRGTPTPKASAGCISPPLEKKGASAGSAGVPSTSSIDPRRRVSDPTRNHVAATAQHRKPSRRRRRRGYPSDGESHYTDPIGPREGGAVFRNIRSTFFTKPTPTLYKVVGFRRRKRRRPIPRPGEELRGRRGGLLESP
jgi:hypothetical protein